MWFGSDKGPWRTLVRTEQAERLLTAIDASMSCQVISCGSTRGAMVKTSPRQSKAWRSGFRGFAALARTALTIDGCAGEKTQTAATASQREISAAAGERP